MGGDVDDALFNDDPQILYPVVGAAVVGAAVVGAAVVGAAVVGAFVVGAAVVGAFVVGAAVVGAFVVGAAVVVVEADLVVVDAGVGVIVVAPSFNDILSIKKDNDNTANIIKINENAVILIFILLYSI
jgi:hypothetical protein